MRLLSMLSAAAAILLLAVPAPLSAETLTIGAVTGNLKKELKRTLPLATYLQDALSADGVTAVEFKAVKTTADMAREMAEGRIDIMFDSPLVAAIVARDAEAEPFVRRWKDGIASYHSVVIVPAESEIETLRT